MNGYVKKAGLAIALGATALTVAAPASAQRYYRHHGHRGGGDTAAAAIIGGVIGLGVGAAIASNNNDRYYDRGYYEDRGYPAYRAYPRPYYRSDYAPPPPPPPPRAYYCGYYDRPGYYGW